LYILLADKKTGNLLKQKKINTIQEYITRRFVMDVQIINLPKY